MWWGGRGWICVESGRNHVFWLVGSGGLGMVVEVAGWDVVEWLACEAWRNQVLEMLWRTEGVGG